MIAIAQSIFLLWTPSREDGDVINLNTQFTHTMCLALTRHYFIPCVHLNTHLIHTTWSSAQNLSISCVQVEHTIRPYHIFTLNTLLFNRMFSYWTHSLSVLCDHLQTHSLFVQCDHFEYTIIHNMCSVWTPGSYITCVQPELCFQPEHTTYPY